MIVLTFGTFDLLHVGHVRLLERAESFSGSGGKLIVGVSSDQLNYEKKNRYPVYSQSERLEIIKAIGCVDEVFLEESLELKVDYIKRYKADILIMGDDWISKFDYCKDECPELQVIYLPRTPGISTSEIVDKFSVV